MSAEVFIPQAQFWGNESTPTSEDHALVGGWGAVAAWSTAPWQGTPKPPNQCAATTKAGKDCQGNRLQGRLWCMGHSKSLTSIGLDPEGTTSWPIVKNASNQSGGTW